MEPEVKDRFKYLGKSAGIMLIVMFFGCIIAYILLRLFDMTPY